MADADGKREEDRDEPEEGAKRVKCEAGEETGIEYENFLADFKISSVLNRCDREKSIIVHGKLGNQSAVVILEKTPIREDSLTAICTGSRVKLDMKNDNFCTLSLLPPPHLNEITATVMYKASDMLVKKYKSQPVFMVEETRRDYETITLPFIHSQSFSPQWVYNILEKKAEMDRIIFEDPDPKFGFILLPDLKWDQKQISNLCLIAIVHKRNIKSLRDLTSEHIPLLQNIFHKGQVAILRHYNLPGHKLRIYLHYQPSFYHLHVHFTHVTNGGPGCVVGRAHLLTNIIQNLQFEPQYYRTRVLYFSSYANNKLVEKFKEAGRLQSTICPHLFLPQINLQQNDYSQNFVS